MILINFKYIFITKRLICFLLVCFCLINTKAQVNLFNELKPNTFKLFVAGECHLKKDYTQIYDVIMQLYQKQGVRRVVLELPVEHQLNANDFLLDSIEQQNKIYLNKYSINKEEDYYIFMNKLRIFNTKIKEDSNKIQVVFPDITSVLYNGLQKIGYFKQKGETENQTIIKLLSKIKDIKLFFTRSNISKKRVKRIRQLKSLLDSYPLDFKNLYLDDYQNVSYQINLLYKTQQVYLKYNGNFPDSVRERFVYEHIYNSYKANPNVNYFAEYGGVHTIINYDVRKSTGNFYNLDNSMTSLLNSPNELKGKIYNMLFYYNKVDAKTSACAGTIDIDDKPVFSDKELQKYSNLNNSKYLYIPVTELERAEELKKHIKMIIFVN